MWRERVQGDQASCMDRLSYLEGFHLFLTNTLEAITVNDKETKWWVRWQDGCWAWKSIVVNRFSLFPKKFLSFLPGSGVVINFLVFDTTKNRWTSKIFISFSLTDYIPFLRYLNKKILSRNSLN